MDLGSCFGPFGRQLLWNLLSCEEAEMQEPGCAPDTLFFNTIAYNWGIGRAAELGYEYLAHFDTDIIMLQDAGTDSASSPRDWLGVATSMLSLNPNAFSIHPDVANRAMISSCIATHPPQPPTCALSCHCHGLLPARGRATPLTAQWSVRGGLRRNALWLV